MANPTPQLPSPVLAPRPRFFSAIWLVPLAAAIIGLWLAYTSYRDRGPEILIRFATGAGIVPGKTPIKYHGVTVGMVKHIELDPPTGEVNVRARLNQDAADFAREDTLFWMVSPRISLKEASGLDTLLSGQYITLRPGQGEYLYRFKALEAPPAGGMNAPGLHIVLLVDEIGALSAGAPVLHRDVRVGQVTHFDPPTDAGPIRLHLNIEENHAALVRANTRFWNASGLSLDAGLDGFRFRMESISSVIEGGVAFSTAPGESPGEPAVNDTVFPLHPDRETALEAGPVVLLDCSEPEGVRAGTPLRWRGAPAGRVRSVRLRAGLAGAELEVALKPEAADLARAGALYWLVRPGFTEAGAHGLAALATGPYLEAAAGPGAATNRFVCAEEPPVFLPDAPGLHLVLLTPRALPRGTPIRSRGIRVGELQGSEFDAQTGWLTAHATVEKTFAKHLTASASFWLEDGARVEANWNGVRAVVPSLAGLVTTGIAVEIAPGGKPAQDGMIFPLHESRQAAMPEGLALTLRMAEARGLLVGALVNYRGVEIGEVEALDPKPGDPTHPVHARLRLRKGMEAFATGDARYWLVEPQLGLHGSSNLFAYVTGPWLEARPGAGARVESVEVTAATDWKHAAPAVVLRAPRATGVDAGDPVFFMGVEAGEITARALEDGGSTVRLEARLQPAFQPYLRADSRFFEREGLRVTGGLGGLTVETGSLSSLVAGGVGFYNPPGPGAPAAGPADYPLHVSETSARAGGRPLTVTLPEARGLARGAEVKHQGVSIGTVEAVRLLPDRSGVAADLRLHDGMDDFARATARYWLVSADISLRGVRDPETLVTGPYLAALPGAGEPAATLRALPAAPGGEEPGLNLVLRVNRGASLSAGVPVMYRDLPVGRVTGVDLAPRGDHVRVGIRIAPRFAGLVTADSRFWNAGGFGMNVGLFGAKVRSSTLESLLSGAISFATPAPGPAPAAGTEFPLAQEPQDDWLKWSPALPVGEGP